MRANRRGVVWWVGLGIILVLAFAIFLLRPSIDIQVTFPPLLP